MRPHNALARWVSPWKAVDRYTFAQLDPVPEKLFVPFAEPFPLSAALPKRPSGAGRGFGAATRKDPALRVARRGSICLRDPAAKGTRETLAPGRRCEGTDPRRAPPRQELASLEAEVRLPDYLRYSKDPVVPVRGNTLTLVEGSEATIRGTTTRELAAAQPTAKPS